MNSVRDILDQITREAVRAKERAERERAAELIAYPCSCGSVPTLDVCEYTGVKRIYCLDCLDAEYVPDGPRANHYVHAEGKTWREAIDEWDGDRAEEQ